MSSNTLRIDVSKATKELQKIAKDLTAAKVNQSISRAINHTLGKAKTSANKMVRDAYKMPADEVRNRIFINQASSSSLTGKLIAVKAPLPIAAFNPKAVIGNIVTKRVGSYRNANNKKVATYGSSKVRSGVVGVTIEIVKGQTKTIKSAFLAIGRTSAGSVKAAGKYADNGFEFSDDGKGKRTTMNTKSVFWAIQSQTVGTDLTNQVRDDYRARVQHELIKGLKYAQKKA